MSDLTNQQIIITTHNKTRERYSTSDNTAYTLRADALALRDIASFGRNVVYAGNVICN
jgi:hypothetical protein